MSTPTRSRASASRARRRARASSTGARTWSTSRSAPGRAVMFGHNAFYRSWKEGDERVVLNALLYPTTGGPAAGGEAGGGRRGRAARRAAARARAARGRLAAGAQGRPVTATCGSRSRASTRPSSSAPSGRRSCPRRRASGSATCARASTVTLVVKGPAGVDQRPPARRVGAPDRRAARQARREGPVRAALSDSRGRR